MWIRCGRWKRPCWNCRMRGGDQPRSVVSGRLLLIFWPLKATVWNGLRVIIRLMKKIKSVVWVQRPASQPVSVTSRFHARKIPPLLLAEGRAKNLLAGRCAKRLKAGAHSLNQRVKIAAIALDKGGVFIPLGFQHGNIFNFQINDFNRLVFTQIAELLQYLEIHQIYPWQCR